MASIWQRFLRAMGFQPEPIEVVDLGTDFAGDTGQSPDYAPKAPGAAATRFSWVYAAASRRAAAAASLPIEVYRLDAAGKRVVLQEHWLYDLLEYPSTAVDGVLFRRELWTDFDLSGQAHALIVGKPGRTCSLQRLHPARVREIVSPQGEIGWEYQAGTPIRYSLDSVLTVRKPALGDDPNEFFHGIGGVQPLDKLLNLEWNALDRASKASKSGRPALMATPKEGQIPDRAKRRELAQSISQDLRQYEVLVASGAMDFEQLGWTAEDLQFVEALNYARQAVLAVLQVPPVELGLETANFATAKEQAARFWAGIAADLPMFDLFWTRLLRLAGEKGVYVRTVTEGIKELSAWRDPAWLRVQTAVFSGVPLEIALETEGLSDVAERMKAAPKAPAIPATEEPPADTRGWWGGVTRALRGEPEPWPPTEEAGRAAVWNDVEKGILSPSERGMRVAASRYLQGAARRIGDNLSKVWPISERASVRPAVAKEALEALVDEIMAQIFAPGFEAEQARSMLQPSATETFRRAFLGAVADAQRAGATVDPSRVEPMVDAVIGEKLVPYPLPGDTISAITETTYTRIRELVSTGLADGASSSEMASWLILDEGFSPARALRIARTETTRAVSAGQERGFQSIEDETGTSLRRQWLSARGPGTREEHWALDGQEIDRGQSFSIPAAGNGHASDPAFVGLVASAPGGFGVAAQDCNCRCTVVPVVRREAEEEAA
jgi:phage portal protein BeeE